jgi:hypothetical protein
VSDYARRLIAPWRLELSAQVQLVAVLSATAWIAGVSLWLDGPRAAANVQAPQWWCMPGMASSPGAVSGQGLLLTGTSMWLLMTLAMALPGELPAAQFVAMNSFPRNRSSAVSVFVAVYLAAWLSCGVAITALASRLASLPAGVLFATALALAAGYELTPLKRRALNRCHRGAALPAQGARRLIGVAHFGWINASGCLASCSPAMLAAWLAPVPQPLAMGGFAFVMTYERLTRRPLTARRRIASIYLLVLTGFILAAV